tara:strand:+ start:5129 stop:5467 length:339 start_codon:yes stop_codon:yes gene_type:complete
MSNYVAYSRDEIITENYSNIEINKKITELTNLVKQDAHLKIDHVDVNSKNNKQKLNSIIENNKTGILDHSNKPNIIKVMNEDSIKVTRNEHLLTSLGMITAATLIVFIFFKK